MTMCPDCARRAQVLAVVSPYLEHARDERRRLHDVLALGESELVRAVGGRRVEELRGRIRAMKASAGPGTCPHGEGFPRLALDDATIRGLHVAGAFERLLQLTGDDAPSVAIVGTRRASPEGLKTARELGRGLAAAGVTVVSGMALGIDSAAHEGALDGGGHTVAVLASGADAAYPRSKSALHQRIVDRGVVVSEMPPGTSPRRWGFPARNRIIAAMSQATIVVEAAQRSGSLITAEFALELGREVLAVPGSVRSWRADGTNALIRDGATLVRDACDVLDALLGPEMAERARGSAARTFVAAPPGLDAMSRLLLTKIEAGTSRSDELVAVGSTREAALAGLAELELLGLVRRMVGGEFERCRAVESVAFKEGPPSRLASG